MPCFTVHLASSHPMCKQLAAHPMASKLGFPISAPPLPLPCALTLPVNAKPVVAKAKQRNSCFLAFPPLFGAGSSSRKNRRRAAAPLEKNGLSSSTSVAFYPTSASFVQKSRTWTILPKSSTDPAGSVRCIFFSPFNNNTFLPCENFHILDNLWWSCV